MLAHSTQKMSQSVSRVTCTHPFTWIALQSVQLYDTLFFSDLEQSVTEEAPKHLKCQKNVDYGLKMMRRGRRYKRRDLRRKMRENGENGSENVEMSTVEAESMEEVPLDKKGHPIGPHVMLLRTLSIEHRQIFSKHRNLCIKYTPSKCWMCWVRSVGVTRLQGGIKSGCICGRLQKQVQKMQEEKARYYASEQSAPQFPKPIRFYLLFNAHEVWNASNSGKLLFHLLPNSTQFAICEIEMDKIREWIRSIRAERGGIKKVLVLFPHKTAVPISQYFEQMSKEERQRHRVTGKEATTDELFQHVFILDTTWKAARQLAKNLYRDYKDDIQFISLDLSQICEQTNRFALKKQSKERVATRRLCTIEAVCEALKELQYPPFYADCVMGMLDVVNEYILRSKGKYELQRERHPEKFAGAVTFEEDVDEETRMHG